MSTSHLCAYLISRDGLSQFSRSRLTCFCAEDLLQLLPGLFQRGLLAQHLRMAPDHTPSQLFRGNDLQARLLEKG